MGTIKKPVERVPCHYCQREVGPGALTFTWDHVVPQAIGGRNTRWNVVPSCQKCNSDKADKYPTHDCSFCRRTRRRHWEENRIADRTKKENISRNEYRRRRAAIEAELTRGGEKRVSAMSSVFEAAQASELRKNTKRPKTAPVGTFRDGWVKTEDGWALARVV